MFFKRMNFSKKYVAESSEHFSKIKSSEIKMEIILKPILYPY